MDRKARKKEIEIGARDMPAESHPERVFVYGTLRRGGGGEHRLANASFAGPANVPGRLLAGPGYPVLVLDGDAPVQGEIWRCDAETLADLDAYEGVDEGLFRRVRREIGGAPAWVYVAGACFERTIDRLEAVTGGDWLRHLHGNS